jgi:hypothetical protein
MPETDTPAPSSICIGMQGYRPRVGIRQRQTVPPRHQSYHVANVSDPDHQRISGAASPAARAAVQERRTVFAKRGVTARQVRAGFEFK